MKAEEEGRHFPIIIPKLLRSLSAMREVFIGLTPGCKLTLRELSTYWLLVLERCIKGDRSQPNGSSAV
jgi:hypothetical protein